MTNLEAFYDAVKAWAEAQTGLTIIWGKESAPQPAYPYGWLRLITGPNPIGSIDEVRLSTDLGQDPGEEVLQQVVGQRRAVVSLQILNRRDKAAAYDVTEDPASLMAQAQASLRLPTVIAAFDAAEVAVLTVGAIVDLSGLEGDKDFTDRRQMDTVFGLAFEVSERTGYIERALVTSDLGAPSSVELDDEPLGG